MYISELNLHGFKSFAHKTKVTFDSGITAIVGPNGCGKSNIVDSLRWVLGEQRPSLLRSSAMSNIIFNGTANKKALGLAEVSLTFVNNKGLLPMEYSEVTITRRLYRSGDSEYLINNTSCRLKDIMELFMDTGMGADAYSVIELKMVEEILNDKNNDRRRLFEEAAGVTRYKDQRKRTLRKLEETQKDVQRLEDLLIEVRKKVRSLELQAERAEKAKKYSRELELLDQALARHDHGHFVSELQPLEERIDAAEKEKNQLHGRAEQLEAEEEAHRTKLGLREKEQAEAQKLVSQLSGTIREAQTMIQISTEKVENEKQVQEQYRKDIAQSEADRDELKTIFEQSVLKLEEMDAEHTKAENILQETKRKFSEVQQSYSKERHTFYELEVKLSEANNERNRLKADQIKIESRLENTEGDIHRIDEEVTDLNDEILNLNGEQSIIEKKLNALMLERDDIEEKLEEQRKRREQLSKALNDVKDSIRNQQSTLDAIRNESRLLNDLSASHEEFPGSVHYLMDKHRFDFGTMIPVSDIFTTDEKYAVALEAALGEVVHYVVVSGIEDAKRAGEFLRSAKKGKATFIPLDNLEATYPVAAHSLFHKVKCKPEYFALKQLLLGEVLLLEEENSDVSAKNNGGITVSLKGDVMFPNRFLKIGSTHKNAGVRLSLANKLEKLAEAEKKALKEIGSLELYREQVEKKQGKLDISALSQDLKTKETEIRTFEQQLHSMRSKVQVYQKNISELINRKDSLESNEGTAHQALEELLPRQKELGKKMLQLEKEIETKREYLQSLEDERTLSQSRYNDARLRHQDLSNQMENIQRDIKRAESGLENLKIRIGQRQAMILESEERQKQNEQQIAGKREQVEKVSEQKKLADSKLEETTGLCARQRGIIIETERELREIRKQREVSLELVHHLSMAREKLQMQVQSTADHIWETYGLLMGQVHHELPEGMTTEEAKAKISTLRQRLHGIGEVNHLAIEEYKEEKERLEFNENQINDLKQAEKQLLEAIAEVNKTATERFNVTFEQIRTNFIKVFKTLFNEDDYCDLIITRDEEDPLEARIEIKAQPKGKRPLSINQLSGGEKTLTAIALLFAIYLVKPSPFCVLDEVDAPLDDANIERFAKMIREFSDETQFIIITHNKKTMSKAEMMYGVTMPETGVSRLVGVRMDEFEDVE